NPIGGARVEGNVVEDAFRSFVGHAPLAVRHGLTLGELGRFQVRHRKLDVDYAIEPVEGWCRIDHWPETGLPWVTPSPNMPTVDTAPVYPGTCLVEGTNLSEGRGTTRPFELVGAPWLDGRLLARALAAEGLPGVSFREAWFRPTFHKWGGETCG